MFCDEKVHIYTLYVKNSNSSDCQLEFLTLPYVQRVQGENNTGSRFPGSQVLGNFGITSSFIMPKETNRVLKKRVFKLNRATKRDI